MEKCPLGLKNQLKRFCFLSCLSHCTEQNILGLRGRIFITCGKNVYLESHIPMGGGGGGVTSEWTNKNEGQLGVIREGKVK